MKKLKKTKEQLEKEKVKFIPCNDFTQTYNFQRTNKKSSYIDKKLKK